MIVIAHVLFFRPIDAVRSFKPACSFHLQHHEISFGIHDRRAEVVIGVEVPAVFGVGCRLDRDVLRKRLDLAIFGDEVEHAAIDVELAFVFLYLTFDGFTAAECHLTGCIDAVIREKNRLDRGIFFQRNGKKTALPGIVGSSRGGRTVRLCILCALSALRLLRGSGLLAAAGREAERHDQTQSQGQNTDHLIVHSVLLAMISLAHRADPL